MTLTYRSNKGSALTYAELDENFRDLQEDTDLDRVLKNGNFSEESIFVNSIMIANSSINGIASEEEALEKTNNTKIMTPLRVGQVLDSIDSIAPVIDFQEFTSSDVWTKPDGVSMVYVEVIGAGGSGAAYRNNTNAGASGGGGGQFNSGFFRAEDLTLTVTVALGAGGAAVVRTTNGLSIGNSGGDSSFGAYLVGKGGLGGGATYSAGTAIRPPANTLAYSGGAMLIRTSYNSGSALTDAVSITHTPIQSVADGQSTINGGAAGGNRIQGQWSYIDGESNTITVPLGTTGNGGVSQNHGNGGASAYGSGPLTATSGSAPGGGGGASNTTNSTNATSGAGADGRVRVWAW